MGETEDTLYLGVDIGGTFTDFVALDPSTGSRFLGKTLTTPKDPCVGVLDGFKELLSKIKKPAKNVKMVIHATTLATNLIVERKGAKVGLITTGGFRDVVEMRTEARYDLYDLFIRFPPPLCPRYLRIGVNERLNYKGEILVPLDGEEIKQAVSELKTQGIESLAVCFLHSYANPVHELQAEEIASESAPEIPVTISYRIQPEIREYARVSTTVANAYILPKMKDYITQLEDRLGGIGCKGDLYMMLSNGGITTPKQASEVPIMLCESGPAAGTAAAQYFSGIMGLSDILSFDMGGTTAKICIITGGVPTMKMEFEAARIHRFKRGSGVLINTPVVDLIDIGAGGGSIAKVGVTGLIDVGPESAGADPGPVCYGLGGSEPTVTDANLILGYLNPDYFLGGEMNLYPTDATDAIEDKIAKPLGLSVVETAWGIHEITNENMANAARMHILENGYDPRNFTLMAFGGAGPVHACRLARKLGIKRVVIPYAAGVVSAYGLLVSPMSMDFMKTYMDKLDCIDWEKINRMLDEMEIQGRQIIGRTCQEEIKIERFADLRHVGQGYEVITPIPEGKLSKSDLATIKTAFNREYQRLFNRTISGVPLEVLNWRLRVSGAIFKVKDPSDNGKTKETRILVRKSNSKRTTNEATDQFSPKHYREVYFEEMGGYVECPVYERSNLCAEVEITGPIIIEEKESTTVVSPGASCMFDQHGNLILEFQGKYGD